MVVHLDTIYVIYEGKGHRSKFKIRIHVVIVVGGATSGGGFLVRKLVIALRQIMYHIGLQYTWLLLSRSFK